MNIRTLVIICLAMFSPLLAHAIDPAPYADGVSETCQFPPTEFSQEEGDDLLGNFREFALEQGTGVPQNAILNMSQNIFKFSKAGNTQTGKYLVATNPSLLKDANKYVHVYKAAGIIKAFVAGDADSLADMALTEGLEKVAEFALGYAGGSVSAGTTAATSIGATVEAGTLGAYTASSVNSVLAGAAAGLIVAAGKTTYESYKELEKQDCLLNLDIGYYKLMDDPKLRLKNSEEMPKGTVDHFVRNYIVGNNEERAKNRRILQCYINENMGEGNKVDISYMDSSGEYGEVAARIEAQNTVDVIHGEKKNLLRTTAYAFLRDLNHRKDIEETREKMKIFLLSNEYKELMKMANSARFYTLANNWLCEQLKTDVRRDFIGLWNGMVSFNQPLFDDGTTYDDWMIDFSINEAGEVTGNAWMHDPEEAPTDRILYPIKHSLIVGNTLKMTIVDRYESFTSSGEIMTEDRYVFKGNLTGKDTLIGNVTGKVLDSDCDFENDMKSIQAVIGNGASGTLKEVEKIISGDLSSNRSSSSSVETQINEAIQNTEFEKCKFLSVDADWKVIKK